MRPNIHVEKKGSAIKAINIMKRDFKVNCDG